MLFLKLLFPIIINNQMGISESFECCSIKMNQNEFRVDRENNFLSANDELPSQSYQFLRVHIRELNLLGALNYQIQHIQKFGIQVAQFNSEIKLISRFLEMIEYEAKNAFLSILESKTTHFTKQKYSILEDIRYPSEICLLDISPLKSKQSSALLEKQLQQCFKMLQLLKLDHPMDFYDSSVFVRMIVSEIKSIPQIEEFVWDLSEKKSLQSMAFHLFYNIQKILPALNSTLSLNDPTSYLHVRHFYHLANRYFCSRPSQLLSQSFIYIFAGQQTQNLLYRTNSILITTNFLQFEARPAVNGKHPLTSQVSRSYLNESQNRKTNVCLLLKVSSKTQWQNKFIHQAKLYFLPFTMFLITSIVRRPTFLEVHLQQFQQQLIQEQLDVPLNSALEDPLNHVLINQSNLLNEMKSLRSSLQSKLDSLVVSLKDSHENSQKKLKDKINCSQLFIRYYQLYNRRLLNISEGISPKSVNDELQPDKHLEESEQKSMEQSFHDKGQSQIVSAPLIELEQGVSLTYKKKLDKYIKTEKLQQLYKQIFDLKHFFYLQSLNLSQSWLQKIECLECFPNLKQLFLYSNEIATIEGLDNNTQLKVLSFSRNRIKIIENIDHLLQLQELYITKNLLSQSSAQYLTSLNIKTLSVLSISFREHPDLCLQVIAQRIPFRIGELTLNEADLISSRTKNMLKKRLKKTIFSFVAG